jgi:hypothetical protein
MNKLFSYFSTELYKSVSEYDKTKEIIEINKNENNKKEEHHENANQINDNQEEIDSYLYVTHPDYPSVSKSLVCDWEFDCESKNELNYENLINNNSFNVQLISEPSLENSISNIESILDNGIDNRTDNGIENRPDNRTDNGIDNRTDNGIENRPDNGIDNRPDNGINNSNQLNQVKIPIIFVQDIFNNQNIVKDYLQDLDSRIIFADVNPLGSVYDRAIQLFHEIKGEICYFGKNCLRSVDRTTSIYGKFPQWSEIFPVHFICLGYGGNTVRELLYLLKSKKIPKFDNTENYGKDSFYETSEKWISSIVTIASPLCGIDIYNNDWNYYLTKNMIHNSMAIKYVGWSILLSRKSNSLQEYLSTKKLQYWNLPAKECIFLSEDALQHYLNNNTCFTDLKNINFKSILCDCKVPVLKIVLNDNKCNLSFMEKGNFNTFFSHRFFYGENTDEKKIDDVKQFNKYEFQDSYIVLDESISIYDILDSPTFDEYYLRKSYIIHKIINDIYILLSNW